MLVGDGTRLVELGGVEGNGLLAEHVLASCQSGAQVGDMRVMRRGDIDRVDVRIGIEVLDRVIDLCIICSFVFRSSMCKCSFFTNL